MVARSRVVFNRLPQIAAQIGPALDGAARSTSDRLADQIRGSVRIKTGELRESIDVAKADDGYAVVSGADQALSEEFGTARQAPHPTFGPAATAGRGPFVDEARSALGKIR